MGGFLLVKRNKEEKPEEIERRFQPALETFKKRNQSLNKKIVRDGFVLYVFHKIAFETQNLLEFENGDFIVSTGTCIYKGKAKDRLLKEYYEDFTFEAEAPGTVYGCYCNIVFKEGELFILNDITGQYHVYCAEDMKVISSSFIAVVKSLKERTVSEQELYEYVINGALFGDKTVFKEVHLIDSFRIWRIYPEIQGKQRKLDLNPFEGERTSFDYLLRRLSDSLYDYFSIIRDNFGDDISSALSGGLDSRLMLAVMRKAGIKPYLYVYDYDPLDVKYAEQIAKGEGFDIDTIYKNKTPHIPLDGYHTILESNFYLNDGLGTQGIFDNGSDMQTRLDRVEKGQLQLNGAGAGNLMNVFNLPNGVYSIRSFLRSKFEALHYDYVTGRFEKQSYFNCLVEKIKAAIQRNKSKITRLEIEYIESLFDSKYWMGINSSVNNQFGYALTPFAEYEIARQSVNIPIKYKNNKRFKMALNKFNDPKLAKYPSVYGYNFYDEPPLKVKLYGYIKVYSPIFLRPLLRSELAKKRGGRVKSMPYYLTGEYIDAIFGKGEKLISQYVHLDKMGSIGQLSRALTLESLLAEVF